MLVLVLLVGACSGAAAVPSILPTTAPTPTATAEPTASRPTFPLTLTDDEGNQVVVSALPQRIVSLTPATTELLFALGLEGRLVGVTDFDDYPPEAKAIDKVASFTAVDVEKIVSLEADLVIAGGNHFNPPEALARLRSLGIPVVVVYAASVDGILADFELLGRAVGASPAADGLSAWMRGQFEAIETAAQTRGGPPPRVFYELDATNEIYGPSAGSFLASMIELAGGDPITTGDPVVFSISLERLVAADPEVIVLGDAAYGMSADQVAGRPGWGTITAVKRGAIRPVDDTVVTRPGPRLVEGLRALALAIDPVVALPPEVTPPPIPAP